MNAFAEAVKWVNGMIQDGYIEPNFHVTGSAFEQHYNEQMSKRNQCSLTNEQIRSRLSELNRLENNRQAQEQEKLAGLRKNNTVAKPLSKAMDALEEELNAYVRWNAARKRFELEWK